MKNGVAAFNEKTNQNNPQVHSDVSLVLSPLQKPCGELSIRSQIKQRPAQETRASTSMQLQI